MKRGAGVVVLAAGLILSGCTQMTDGTPKAGFASPGGPSGASGYKAQTCEQLHSDAWIEVPGTGPDEPRVRVAQPPGWVPVPEFAKGPVKLVLRNESLTDGVTNPAISVSIGDATDGDRSPKDLLSETIKGFQSIGAQNITQVPSEILWFPRTVGQLHDPARRQDQQDQLRDVRVGDGAARREGLEHRGAGAEHGAQQSHLHGGRAGDAGGFADCDAPLSRHLST
ncbi:hypothetical protein [Mycolicibacterium peregrinum]|uniref:hypothetical protein n=1 Tax=Mycolicibacterium peregrinum TaxID=43304 RepID=UPI003AAEA659